MKFIKLTLMYVNKRDGTRELVDYNKIMNCIKYSLLLNLYKMLEK